jgi:hypothetical protein
MTRQPNASAASHLKTRRFLFVAIVAEAIGAGALATGWYQPHASAALEMEQASSLHLATMKQRLSEKTVDLERCNAWMNARLLLAEGLDEPARSAPALLPPSAPIASAMATASAAPAESASAAPLAHARDSNEAEANHFQRRRRVLEVHGQSSFLESPEPSAAKPSP